MMDAKRKRIESEDDDERGKNENNKRIGFLNFKFFVPINHQLWTHMSQYPNFTVFSNIMEKLFKRKSMNFVENSEFIKFINDYLTNNQFVDKEIKGWKSLPNNSEEFMKLLPGLHEKYIKDNFEHIVKYANTILLLMNCVLNSNRKSIFMSIAAKVEGRVEKYSLGGTQSLDTTLHEQIYIKLSDKATLRMEVEI